MNGKTRLLAVVAVALGLAAYMKRPIRRPESRGSWRPVDREPSPR